MADFDNSELLHAGRRLYGHLSPRRQREMVLILVMMLAGAVSEFLTIGAVLPFIAVVADVNGRASNPTAARLLAAAESQNRDALLIEATALFVVVALVAGIVRLALAWASQRFVFRLGCDLGVEVYKHTLYQPYSFHVAKSSNEILAGVEKIQAVIFNVLLPFMQMTTSVIVGLFILGALVAIDAKLALTAMAGFAAMYLGITYFTRGRLRANSHVISQAYTRRIETVQEGLGAIRDVLLDQAQPHYLKRFEAVDSTLRDAQATNVFVAIAPRFVIEALGMVLIAALAIVESFEQGGFSSGLPMLGALALGAQRLLPLLQLVYTGWAQIAGNRGALIDILDMLDRPVHANHSIAASPSKLPFTRSIEFESVSYRYSNARHRVLEHLSLSISKGARVGLIGATGSGKSTLLDLLMGLIEPVNGTIKIDGCPLTGNNVRHWQAQIAHVPQSIYLADATIAENIAFGVFPEMIDLGRVRDAARRAALGAFVDKLPYGLSTRVGERGVQLSGGQRQRIGIARALYKRASVLVLDEATSALDRETESMVIHSIGALGRDLTILIIAHRLSTIEICDVVYEVEGGGVRQRYDISKLGKVRHDA